MNNREILIAKSRSELLTSQPKWVADWYVIADPENSASIPETLDGTRHVENIDQWLRVKIRFIFNFKNDLDYAEAERIFLLGSFVCDCFLPIINKRFIGNFMLNRRQLNLFLMLRNNYIGVTNYQIEAESKFTYDSIEELEKYSESDDRF